MNAKYKHFMCRLCLCKSGTLSDIHGCKVGSGLIAAAVISDLLQLEVSATDHYPQLVCLECLKKLYDFRRFKDSCWKAKFNFDTFYANAASPDVHVTEGMCEGGVNTVINHGDSMETSEEYSNPYPEKYVEETKFIIDIDIKDEPIEESFMRDPLSLDSSDSNVEEISEEDITIKEEEIEINERLSAEEAPVTFIEKEEKITITEVKSDIEVEDTKGPPSIKMPDLSSTKDLCREISSTNGADYSSNQVKTKQLEENDLIKETIGPTGINNTLSSSMLLVPVNFLVNLNVQGQNQNNSYTGEVAQNEGTVVDEMKMREEGKYSAIDGKETGAKEGKNLIKEGPDVGKNKGKTTSVQYFCQKCCKMFSSMCDLVNHNCATEVVKNYDCTVCGKKFETEKILWNHIRKHNWNMRLFCQICGKGFLREEYLSMHLASHKINSPLQPVTASSTVSSIPSVENVSDTGQFQKNSDQEEVVSDSNVASISKKEQVENKLWKSKSGNVCPICGGVYSTLYTLKRHLLQRHSEKNFKCSLCPKKFRTEKGVECHSKKHRENRPYRCEVCGKGFLREDFFAKHVSNHARDDPFQCDRCGKKFNQKRPLWSHVARCYKTKRYKCDICNKKYHSEAYLLVHKTIHTGEKNLMCEVCGKTFRGLGTLAIHRRQHTGEKPYHCDICNRSFTQRISFVNHNKRYHK